LLTVLNRVGLAQKLHIHVSIHQGPVNDPEVYRLTVSKHWAWEITDHRRLKW